MKYISELNPHNYPVNDLITQNIDILFQCLEELQSASGFDFAITSGLRSESKQLMLIKSGKSNALHSKHLSGLAADLYDPEAVIYDWCKRNGKILESLGFWCEERQGNWLHVQIVPPASGKRWFKP